MIVIMHMPRTGSNSLSDDLAMQHRDYSPLGEIISIQLTEQQMANTLDYCMNHDKWIVKVAVNWAHKCVLNGTLAEGAVDALCERADVVYYTTRDDLLAHTKSYYNALKTKEWLSNEIVTFVRNRTQEQHTIEIVESEVRQWAKHIIRNNVYLEDCYNKYPGPIVPIESKNKPYTYNKEGGGYKWVGEWPNIADLQNEFNEWKTSSNLYKD